MCTEVELGAVRYPWTVNEVADTVRWSSDAPASSPLSPDEVAEAAQVGNRLIAEFRPLFERLPLNARSGLGLARHLAVDRGTATRFVGALGKPVEGVEVLTHFPGVKGLRQIIDAMAAKKLPAGSLTAAKSAVDRFERLIHELAGSQTKLADRLLATRRRQAQETPEAHDQMLRARRQQLFQAASAALGQQMDLWTVCQVYRPTPGSDTQMDQAMVRGTFGYRARRDAPPYALRSFGRNDGPDAPPQVPIPPSAAPGELAYQALENDRLDSTREVSVFKEFSTDPPPIVTNRGRGKEAVVLIDPQRSVDAAGVDLVVGHVLLSNWRVPWLDTPPTHDVSVYVGTPCARMVFDIFLHRSMAGRCVPSMNLYRTTPAIFSNPSAHWYDLLPYPPTLQIYRPEQARSETLKSPFHRRHPELVNEFFSRLGWAMDEFVGYRIEVEYPYWCGFYSVMFDYAPPVV